MVLVVKNPPVSAGHVRDTVNAWVRKILWRRAWQPTPVFLPRESCGQRWATAHRVAQSQT